MEQMWHLRTLWQLYPVEDHPDGFFPNLAYQHLESHLGNQDYNSALRDFLDENVRMRCPEAPLWAMWEFAVAKGEASSTNGTSKVGHGSVHSQHHAQRARLPNQLPRSSTKPVLTCKLLNLKTGRRTDSEAQVQMQLSRMTID